VFLSVRSSASSTRANDAGRSIALSRVLGDINISYSNQGRIYEEKVAAWTGGQLAPDNTPGFDVWQLPDMPQVTVQVKKKVMRWHYMASLIAEWHFALTSAHLHKAAYYVLFCIGERGREDCFLFPQASVLRRSYRAGTAKALDITRNGFGTFNAQAFHLADAGRDLLPAIKRYEKLAEDGLMPRVDTEGQLAFVWDAY